MKVIDLLNKIANGEEVPKKIQVYSDIFVLDYGNKVYEHQKTRTNLLSIYNGNILNYEVRIKEEKEMCHKCGKYPSEYNQTYCEFCLGISEEDKKIEKITMRAGLVGDIDNKLENLDINIMAVEDKINEIIDYINKEDK